MNSISNKSISGGNNQKYNAFLSYNMNKTFMQDGETGVEID